MRAGLGLLVLPKNLCQLHSKRSCGAHSALCFSGFGCGEGLVSRVRARPLTRTGVIQTKGGPRCGVLAGSGDQIMLNLQILADVGFGKSTQLHAQCAGWRGEVVSLSHENQHHSLTTIALTCSCSEQPTSTDMQLQRIALTRSCSE